MKLVGLTDNVKKIAGGVLSKIWPYFTSPGLESGGVASSWSQMAILSICIDIEFDGRYRI